MAMLLNLPFPSDVYLREEDHTYWNRITGLQHMSVSALKNQFKDKFDVKAKAPQTAKKELIAAGNANPSYLEIQTQTALVEKKWEKNRNDSADHGTDIHQALELYFKTTRIENEHYRKMILAVAKLLMIASGKDTGYHRMFDEITFYSNLYRCAGTGDKPCFRTASNKSILDIFDYKTYLKKGMQYKSDYTNFFHAPISHLEECNFNEAALQLSLYGIMAEEMGFKIGRLGIIFIPPTAIDQPQMIPVNYMKHEAMSIIKETPKFLPGYEPVPTQQNHGSIHTVLHSILDPDDDF